MKAPPWLGLQSVLLLLRPMALGRILSLGRAGTGALPQAQGWRGLAGRRDICLAALMQQEAVEEQDLDDFSKKARGQTQANIELLLECDLLERFNAGRKDLREIFLGLDINTHSTGYSVIQVPQDLSKDPELIRWGRICTKSKKDTYDRGLEICTQLERIRDDIGSETPWAIGVEDYLKSFQTGRFSTQGLFKLSQLHGMVGYGCMSSFSVKPVAYHPSSARAFYSLKATKAEEHEEAVDVKRVVYDHIMLTFGLQDAYAWELSKEGELLPDNFDITDSFLIALYTWHQHLFDVVFLDKDLRRKFNASYKKKHKAGLTAKEQAIAAACATPEEGKGAVKRERAMLSKRLKTMYENALVRWFRQEMHLS
ncbi:unnamed protein product [Chrysoparadoxa australica]